MARQPHDLRKQRRQRPASGPQSVPAPRPGADCRPTLYVGLLGLGVVGSAVYDILQHNAALLTARTGAHLVVRRILVRDPRKPRLTHVPAGLLTTDPAAVVADPGIDLVIEVMGGLHPARGILLDALSSGKAVVCANKELMAECSQELLAVAEARGVDLFCEASVGGGIPILRPLRETLSTGRLNRVVGIVNGTTNYILSEMTASGRSFSSCLADAQAAGYAESDPSADVAGHDAARKLAILASIAFHTHVRTTDVITEGINSIRPEDIHYAAGRGLAVKLLACAERTTEGLEAWVQPCLVPLQHPLAAVGGAFNAIYVEGDEVGQTMFYGQGAGGAPTASAVIGDLAVAAQHRLRGASASRPWARAGEPLPLVAPATGRYYLRLQMNGDEFGPEAAGLRAGASAATAGGGGTAVADPLPAARASELAARLRAEGIDLASWQLAGAGVFQGETEAIPRGVLHQALDRCRHLARPGACLRIHAEANRSNP